MDRNSSKGIGGQKLGDNLNGKKRRQLLKKSLAGGGGLSYADTIGLVICLSVLSQRIGHSEANENTSEMVSIPEISGDQERWTVALSGVAAETLYLSSLVSNLRENLLSLPSLQSLKSSESTSTQSEAGTAPVEIGQWALDLDNMDTSINEYLNNAASTETVEDLDIQISSSYDEQLSKMQQSADKFLSVMQELFADELETLIAERVNQENESSEEKIEEVLLAEVDEGGFNAYGLLGLLGLGGGGGGGGGLLSALGSGAVSRLLSGSAIDAYVSGATVWWDADSDGVLDDDEVSTTTDTDGSYSLDGVGTGGHIVISGGVDIDTGAEVATMKIHVDDISDEGGVTVTPITLLQTYGIDDDLIHEILETDPTIDFGNYDPVEIIESGLGDTVEAARILLHAQQYFALVNSLVALAEEQGYEHHDAIELVVNAIYEEEDHSHIVGDDGGNTSTIADLITIMFPDYGTSTVTDPDDATATITLAEYAASNIVSVNAVIGDYIPDVDSTEIYVHTDEAKAAALISQDDLVANFRTIGKLDPTVNKEDIAAALSTHRDAASIRSDFLTVYKQNIEQQAASGGAMITGVDNITITASDTPTVILSSQILSNDTNLGEGTLELKAIEPLFSPTDYTTLVLADNETQFFGDTSSYNGFVKETDVTSTDENGISVTNTDYEYHFDVSHVPDVINGFVKISIDHFTIVLQRTNLTVDLVEQFKEALALAHPRAPEMYEIEASPHNSDHFYIKHRDGSKINSEDGGSHGPVIKSAGAYVLDDGTELIVGINDAGNVQVTASETAIEELKLNYIAANENNQGHGVIKLALTPTFQEIAVSENAVTEVDEDGSIYLSNETDYVETTNSAITENFFVKLSGVEQTGFTLFDLDDDGITVLETPLVSEIDGVYSYKYVSVNNIDTAYITSPSNFNGDVSLSYKLVSTAGNGKFTGVSEITDQTISYLPVSETGADAGTIVISDTVDGAEVSVESSIIAVVESSDTLTTKYFAIEGGDLSETRAIQLSNLPDGLSAYVDGVLTSTSGGKLSFVVDGVDKTEVSFVGTEGLIQSQFGLLEGIKAVIISKEEEADASTGTTVNFSFDIGGAYGLNVGKSVVESPLEGEPVELGLQVNSIGDDANLQIVIDVSSDNLAEIQNTIALGRDNSGTFINFAGFETELLGLGEAVTLNSSDELITINGELNKRFSLDFEIAAISESVVAEVLDLINTLVIDPGNGNFKDNLNVSIDVKALDENDLELASITSPILLAHDYQPVADGVTFTVTADDLDFSSGQEDIKLSLLKLFENNTNNIDSQEIVYFRLYDLANLGVSVVDIDGNILGRVIDSSGTIEISKNNALNSYLSLKDNTDLPTSNFYVKAFSREPTGEISELEPSSGLGEQATLKFEGVADTPILSMDTKVRGLVDDNVPTEFSDKTLIKIPGSAALDDTDGSESLFIKITPTLSDTINGFVTDFAYKLSGTDLSFVVDGGNSNYRYTDDVAYFDNGVDQSYLLVRASELANLEISRPAGEGAYFSNDFVIEAASIERGFETAGIAYTSELSALDAIKVVNLDDTTMDFSLSSPKSLNVEFLKPATKPEFEFIFTDTAANKFSLSFSNHDATDTTTDLVSILVTNATGGGFTKLVGGQTVSIGAPADVDGVYVFSLDEFFESDGTTTSEITWTGGDISGVTFQAFAVDEIGITNQSSDSDFAVDFAGDTTNAVSNLADPIIIDVDGDGLSFNSTNVSFDINSDGTNDNVGWLSSNNGDDGFLVLLDVDGNGVPTNLTLDGSNLITEYLDGNPNTDAATDLFGISTNGILQLSDIESYTSKKAFLWFDESSNGLGTASFNELASITALEINLNKYSETNSLQGDVLIAGSTSGDAISGSFTRLDGVGALSTDPAEQGSFTANSSMFDVWLPVVSSSSVAGEMDGVSLSNNDTNSNYYEDYENGFDISSIFAETVSSTWVDKFGDELPANLVIAIRAKQAGDYFKLSEGAILESEPTTTWVLNWDGQPTADDAGELEKLRLFTRDNFSGQLEFEVSATALIGTTPLTVKRDLSLSIEARADRLEINVPETAATGSESSSETTVVFTDFSIEKTDIGEDVEVTIQTANSYPELVLSLNGVDYSLTDGNSVTLPYPIYAGDLSVKAPSYLSGDFQLIVNSKSIDGGDENAADQFNLNFSIDATSQGSLVEVSSAQTSILETNPLIPLDITITPEDTDGSEKVSSVTLSISEQSTSSDFTTVPVFIANDGTEINFTIDSGEYKLELESDYYSTSTVNGVEVVNISGSIRTPEFFDGDVTLTAKAVTSETEDASKSSENSAQQQFVIEGVTDGINAEDFQVAGTTIYGSQSLVLSDLVTSVQITDLDEDITIEFELSSEFVTSLENPQSGFYDTVSAEFITSPLTISVSADDTFTAAENLVSRLGEIEIQTLSDQDDFNITASVSTRDGSSAESTSVSKSIFIASTPLVEPLIVNSAGETIETSLSLTEGGQVIYDVAASLNGIINPDNVVLSFSNLPSGFQVTPVGGTTLTDVSGVFSVNASLLTQGVIISPDPTDAAASNYSLDFNFDVSATATYPTGDIKTATVGGGIDIDMIPALDGVDFQSDILVTDADFSIFDLLVLEDSSNEKLFEVVIPQNSFLEVKPAGASDYISLDGSSLTLSASEIISGSDVAVLRRSDNFVGTSDLVIEVVTTDQSALSSDSGLTQSATISFEFNTSSDIIQLFESTSATEILDEAIVNDGRTDTGADVSFNLSVASFSSVNSSDTVSIALTGSSIVDGTEVVSPTGTTYTAQEIGNTGSFQIFIPGDGNSFSALDKASINVPKSELGFGSRDITAKVIIAGKSSVSSASLETEVFDVESDSPPVAQIGFDTTLDTNAISASTMRDDGILLSDFIRVPQMNEGHVLEVISLPKGTSVGFGIGGEFAAITSDQIFEVFTNDNPETIIGYRFTYSDLETASIKIPTNVADGTDELSFSVRVGILDGTMENNEPRYGYSRLSDFSVALGTVHGIENNLIVDADNSNISASDGDDIIIPDINSSGAIDGGNGIDALVLTNAVSGTSRAIVDLNKGELYLSTPGSPEVTSAANTRAINSIETVVGTSGDDTIVANGIGTGAVTLIGAGGDDYLAGGAGDDMISGGQGDDILSGGEGSDTFIISVSDEDGNRDAGTDTITHFDLKDKITFNGFEIIKSEDGSLPGDATIVKNATTGFYEVSIQKVSGDNTLSSLVIIEDLSNLSADETTAIQQITDAIEFNEILDVHSTEPFNVDFEFNFDASVVDLMSSLSDRESFFGDSFEYDDITGALGVIADAKFDYAYKSQLGAMNINDPADGHSIDYSGQYVGLSGSRGDDTLIARDEDSVLYGGDGGSDRLVGGLGNDTLIATSASNTTNNTDIDEDYLRGGAGSDNFVLINPAEINDTLDKIYQLRIEDFNRFEGDRVTLVGYEDHEVSLSDVGSDNIQTAQITSSNNISDSLTIYFDLSIVRDFDSAFNLRMSDFDKIESA
ncbi:hypothetical protein N9C75_03685 [Alphaproteobacteria bacterium]|nr:hypothetical protein [Alphaproteobacteria bacterium]